jgi:hypothetical protein
MKKLLKKIFTFIQKILTILRNNCLPRPLPPHSPTLSPYEMYVKEEIKKCYETFKPYFQKSIFLHRKHYHRFIIKRAKENDEFNKKFYLEFGVYLGTSINFFQNMLIQFMDLTHLKA